MKNILTFIIPVRHPQNSDNWARVKRNLTETVKSLSRQDTDGWKAVIVANEGADLPDLPKGVEVARVNFPPNELKKRGDAQQLYNSIRRDKGRRILAGMLHAGDMGHTMVVDDDDFVSRGLTSFVARHPDANGWYFREGYAWTDGGNLLYLLPDFSRVCGTSHIVRSDLYKLPPSLEAADEKYVCEILGSHHFLHSHLDATGTPLAPLPFAGAIYRIGHAESATLSDGIIRKFFLQRNLLKKPWEIVGRLSRLQMKNRRIEEEFALA